MIKWLFFIIIVVLLGISLGMQVSADIESPRFFESVEEAEDWIDNPQNQLPIVFIADENGVIDFNNYKTDPLYDCDDYAEDYERLALKAGYIITQVPVSNGKIWGIKVTDNVVANHVGNWTKIKNTYYYIESSPSTSRWKLVKVMDAD